MSTDDILEELHVGSISDEVENFFAVTWERVRAEFIRDNTTILLKKTIAYGFQNTKKELPKELEGYRDVRECLSIADVAVLYRDMSVIPNGLCKRILDNLHSAHQGVSIMFSIAQTIVYWPGISVDIENARLICRSCHRNAPSQAKLPPREPIIPTAPFEKIYTDFFQFQGKQL